MTVDYEKRNLQKSSFKNEDLTNTSFMGCDLRGADFSGSNLTGANLSYVKTGITPFNTAAIFLVALVISLASGYVAMLAGTTVQGMLRSPDEKVRAAGIITIVVVVLLLAYYYWKGGRTVITHLLIPVFGIAIVLGITAYYTNLGSGRGMLFLVLALLLVVVMVTIGTIGRSIAGTLSSTVLFMLVAIGGSMFGTSTGGGIGTVIMALSCALISKRAASGAKGFEILHRLAAYTTNKFGTSFRNATLTNANFSHAQILNADFTNADLSAVNWEDSKRENCTPIKNQQTYKPDTVFPNNNNLKNKGHESNSFRDTSIGSSAGNQPKEKESRSEG